jgi:hypothetical protein
VIVNLERFPNPADLRNFARRCHYIYEGESEDQTHRSVAQIRFRAGAQDDEHPDFARRV